MFVNAVSSTNFGCIKPYKPVQEVGEKAVKQLDPKIVAIDKELTGLYAKLKELYTDYHRQLTNNTNLNELTKKIQLLEKDINNVETKKVNYHLNKVKRSF